MGIARNQIRWNGWGWAAHRDAWADREDIWDWLAAEMGMPALLATPPRPLDDLHLPPPRLKPAQIAALAAIAGPDRVHQDIYERAFHAGGRSYRDLLRLRAGELSTAPDAVIYPRGEEEVLAILKLAAQDNIPVVPFGGGTGTAGGAGAGAGVVTLDMSAMDRVLAIDPVSASATAEAGIYGPALERALAAKGVTLGDLPPGFEFSSLGGWIAHPNEATGFGRSGDWLLAMRVATPRGLWEIHTPDLTHLMLGSEGTLGIVTQASVRVQQIKPEITRAWLFRDFVGGCVVLREAAQAAIPHRLLRLCDGEETRFRHALAALENPVGMKDRLDAFALSRRFETGMAALVVNFCDAEAARQFEALARAQGATALGDGAAKAWRVDRVQAPYLRDPLLDRGIGVEIVETAASWSALPAFHAAISDGLDNVLRQSAPLPGAHGLVMSHIGQAHAGGASLTFTCLFPRRLDDDEAQAQAIRHAAADIVMARSPDFDADHRRRETNVLGLAALGAVKAAIDPDGILNPGKLPL